MVWLLTKAGRRQQDARQERVAAAAAGHEGLKARELVVPSEIDVIFRAIVFGLAGRADHPAGGRDGRRPARRAGRDDGGLHGRRGLH